MPEEVLSQFPPTKFYVSEIDPLRDNAIQFALQMKKAGVKVDLTLFKDYVHAFCLLDTDNKLGVSEFGHGTTLVI